MKKAFIDMVFEINGQVIEVKDVEIDIPDSVQTQEIIGSVDYEGEGSTIYDYSQDKMWDGIVSYDFKNFITLEQKKKNARLGL